MVLSLKEHHKVLWMATKSFLRFAFHPILLMSSEKLGEDVLPVLLTVSWLSQLSHHLQV